MDSNICIVISDSPLSLQEAMDFVHSPECGAIVFFTGTVRNHFEGRRVRATHYEGYVEMAGREMQQIVSECQKRWKIGKIAAFHRTGTLQVGEVSVVIAVSSHHREDAFAACRYIIEQIKLRLPVWKREHYEDGEERWQCEI